jgi:hypothetical protein
VAKRGRSARGSRGKAYGGRVRRYAEGCLSARSIIALIRNDLLPLARVGTRYDGYDGLLAAGLEHLVRDPRWLLRGSKDVNPRAALDGCPEVEVFVAHGF